MLKKGKQITIAIYTYTQVHVSYVGKFRVEVGVSKMLLLSTAMVRWEWPHANWSVTDSIRTGDHIAYMYFDLLKECHWVEIHPENF